MRYRLDTGSVIDQETGEILTTRQVVNRLNRQETIKNHRTRQIEAMTRALAEEIENSDGELKQALIRVSKKEIKV